MIGKILAYFAGIITGFIIAMIYLAGIFDYISNFIP